MIEPELAGEMRPGRSTEQRTLRMRLAEVSEDFPTLCWRIDPACRQVCIKDAEHKGPCGYEECGGHG